MMSFQLGIRAFRKLIRPLRRALSTPKKQSRLEDIQGPVVVAVAHPDDEVFCSGLICALRQKEIAVHVLCFTRGEGGDRGELNDGDNLAKVREQEMTNATEALAVSSLTFLDYVDPIALDDQLQAPSVNPAQLQTELRSYLEEKNTAHVFTHGSSGEYWHPAHLCLHKHLRRVTKSMNLPLWGFNAWSANHPLPGILNQDDPSSLSLDGSPHQKQRLQSLQCHQTQTGVFERFSNGNLASFIELTSQENYSKF